MRDGKKRDPGNEVDEEGVEASFADVFLKEKHGMMDITPITHERVSKLSA